MRGRLVRSAEAMGPAAPVARPEVPIDAGRMAAHRGVPPAAGCIAKERNMKVIIASPIFRDVSPSYSRSLAFSLGDLRRAGVDVCVLQTANSLVSIARNYAANAFFCESDADAIVMIDADQGWSTRELLSVITALETSAELVGVPIAIKNLDLEAMRLAALAGCPAGDLLKAGQIRWELEFDPSHVDPEKGSAAPTSQAGPGDPLCPGRRLGAGMLG